MGREFPEKGSFPAPFLSSLLCPPSKLFIQISCPHFWPRCPVQSLLSQAQPHVVVPSHLFYHQHLRSRPDSHHHALRFPPTSELRPYPHNISHRDSDSQKTLWLTCDDWGSGVDSRSRTISYLPVPGQEGHQGSAHANSISPTKSQTASCVLYARPLMSWVNRAHPKQRGNSHCVQTWSPPSAVPTGSQE